MNLQTYLENIMKTQFAELIFSVFFFCSAKCFIDNYFERFSSIIGISHLNIPVLYKLSYEATYLGKHEIDNKMIKYL